MFPPHRTGAHATSSRAAGVLSKRIAPIQMNSPHPNKVAKGLSNMAIPTLWKFFILHALRLHYVRVSVAFNTLYVDF